MLAGGAGTRLGGAKAGVLLAGEPLLHRALRLLAEAVEEVVVVAKRTTPLPAPGDGCEVWIEPDEPRHPLAGVVHALSRAEGRSVLVLAVDLPLVPVALLRELAQADGRGTPALVAACGEELQPLCARYEPAALGPLAAALAAGDRTVAAVRALGPALVAVADPASLTNVNTPADLARAAALLGA